MGRSTKLAVFPEEAPAKSPNRRFLGVREIPVREIIGSISRQNDFDNQFRPLNSYLQERWVNAYLDTQAGGLVPHPGTSGGSGYYVEDGHHRVSIGRALGIAFIPAKVWEYPSLASEPKQCQPEPCPERSPATVYSSVAE